MLRLQVAGVEIQLQTDNDAFFAKRTAEYVSDGTAPVQLSMISHVVDEITLPEGEHLFSANRSRIMRLPDGDMAHYTYSLDRQHIIQLTRYSPDYSRTELWSAVPPNDNCTSIDYEYAYTGFAFANRLSALGGAVLHGSAIAYRGEGVIFSAPSGTGKSTHTTFWKECFGDEVIFVNDDKPALHFPENDRPIVYGNPWSGKTDLNTNIAVPLKAIVFLERGEENAIRQLDFTESMFHISEELVRPFMDEKLGEKLVDRMVQLALGTPVYLLTCTKEPKAAEFARRVLFD
ncbi:MAG: hypothetical protein IJN07_00545 [Clostridia bacterium]|nr:hypothetical protein [Clostridia bacterium]